MSTRHRTHDRRGRCCTGPATRRPGRSTVTFKKTPLNLTWLAPESIDTVGEVFAATVVPFTSDGDVVVARLRRGLELPGGTVEPTDRNLLATVRREAWEEARIVLEDLTLLHVVRMEHRDGLEPTRHVAVYTGMVAWLPPFVREAESLGRHVLSPDEFVEHTTGFLTTRARRDLVDSAWTAVHCPRIGAMAR